MAVLEGIYAPPTASFVGLANANKLIGTDIAVVVIANVRAVTIYPPTMHLCLAEARQGGRIVYHKR